MTTHLERYQALRDLALDPVLVDNLTLEQPIEMGRLSFFRERGSLVWGPIGPTAHRWLLTEGLAGLHRPTTARGRFTMQITPAGRRMLGLWQDAVDIHRRAGAWPTCVTCSSPGNKVAWPCPDLRALLTSH